MKQDNIQILKGWRLKLFHKLLKKGFIEIKNHKLIITDAFMKWLKEQQKEMIKDGKKI